MPKYLRAKYDGASISFLDGLREGDILELVEFNKSNGKPSGWIIRPIECGIINENELRRGDPSVWGYDAIPRGCVIENETCINIKLAKGEFECVEGYLVLTGKPDPETLDDLII